MYFQYFFRKDKGITVCMPVIWHNLNYAIDVIHKLYLKTKQKPNTHDSLVDKMKDFHRVRSYELPE